MGYSKKPPIDKTVLMQNYFSDDDPQFYIYTDGTCAFARSPDFLYQDNIVPRLKKLILANEFRVGEFYNLSFDPNQEPLIKVIINNSNDLRSAKATKFECLIDWNIYDDNDSSCKVCEYIKGCKRNIVCPSCGK